MKFNCANWDYFGRQCSDAMIDKFFLGSDLNYSTFGAIDETSLTTLNPWEVVWQWLFYQDYLGGIKPLASTVNQNGKLAKALGHIIQLTSLH